jgi:alpha-tubulin suppressor-like RCC1 family protein
LGNNSFGQLGQNNQINYSSPVQVGYGVYSNWSQVSCGYGHIVALQSNGTLWAWGLNSYGVLAQSNQTHYSIPVQVGTLSNWTIFPTNNWQSMFAADNTGTLYSWGGNTYGQLGRAQFVVYSPMQISTASNWSQVVTGLNHTLLIDNNSALWGLGNNSYGQLGLGDITHRFSPSQIGSLSSWAQINAGTYHSVAIQSNGTLWTWGSNSYGQLGQNQDLINVYSPVQVGTLSNYSNVYCMNFTTLANLL